MKYIRFFNTLAEARSNGASGLTSPHIDYIYETNTSNYAKIGKNVVFNAEYDDNGYIKRPDNEIWYTSSDGNIVTPYTAGTSIFGANIVSNTYVDGRGVIKFDGPVTMIGNNAFYGCSSLTEITIPDSVTSIGRFAFGDCSVMTSCILGSGVTSIGYCAFLECKSLTGIAIPDSVTSISDSVFENCSGMTSCILPSGLTSIGYRAFYNCYSLTGITIPDSVTSIGNNTFQNCYSLTGITIPDSVTSIGGNAFASCSSLISVICNPITPPSLGNYAFNGNASGRLIYVPSGSVDAYKTATNWKIYSGSIVSM